MKIIILCFMLVAACGKDSNGRSPQIIPTIQVASEENAQYRLVMGALNGKSSFGTASFDFDENSKLHINFNMINFPGQVSHGQSLHTGVKCPTIEDDLNKDGFVDFQEGLKVYGEAALPFDKKYGSNYTYTDEFETTELPADLILEGKALVVYGTRGPLPVTVAPKEGEDAAASLPVACGIIQKVLKD